MSFDREKNIWVRQKSPSKQLRLEQKERRGMHESINESEDDPFGNIPDLTVDDHDKHDVKVDSPIRPQPPAETVLEDTEKPDFDEDRRPVTREGDGVAVLRSR